MLTTFHGEEDGLKLSIESYDWRRTNMRYKAVINDDQLAVLHLQTVGSEDTPDVSELSLCPGVLESAVLPLLSKSEVSPTTFCQRFFIEKLEEQIVYRSRKCLMLYNIELRGVCLSCSDLLNDLKKEFLPVKNEPNNSLVEGKVVHEEKELFCNENYFDDDNAFENEEEDEATDSDPNYEPTSEDVEAVQPTVISILKRDSSELSSDVCLPKKRKGKAESRLVDGEYLCDKCDYKSSKLDNLQYHIKTQHGGESHQCDHCEYKTVHKSNLNIHVASIHHGVRHSCNQCDYKAVTQASLKIHIQKIHEQLKYYCDQCDAVFSLKGSLRGHIRSKHEGEKYKCQYCDYQASQKSHLTVHTKAKHEGEVHHICDKCDYQGTTRANLKHHIRAKHEGFKYPCDRCDYQATSKGNIRKHIEAMHEGVKYPCDQCEYQATHKYHLQAHIRFKHEGITYPCNHCSFQASTPNNLKQHVKRKH